MIRRGPPEVEREERLPDPLNLFDNGGKVSGQPLKFAGQATNKGGVVVPDSKVVDPMLAGEPQSGQEGGVLRMGRRRKEAERYGTGVDHLKLRIAEYNPGPREQEDSTGGVASRPIGGERGVGFEVVHPRICHFRNTCTPWLDRDRFRVETCSFPPVSSSMTTIRLGP